MDDVTKKALEWIREMLGADPRPVARALLAHIDGEPLRQAKALEAMRDENTRLLRELENDAARQQAACDRRAEEVREACRRLAILDAMEADKYLEREQPGERIAEAILEMPLTATPLGGEIASMCSERDTLRARVAELEAERAAAGERFSRACAAEVRSTLSRAEKAEARVAELEADIEVGRETCRRHGTAPSNIDDVSKWPASRLIGLLSHDLAGRKFAVDDAMEIVTRVRADLRETIGALMDLRRQVIHRTYTESLDLSTADAILAKHAKGDT